jgi:hypothetical protein
MASKFRESPHSRRRGLQTPPHLHLGESGQSGLERETGAVCLIIGVSGLGIGRPATRAKALNFIYRNVLAGLKTRFPGLKVRGWHSLTCSLIQIRQNVFRRPIRSSRNVETQGTGTTVPGYRLFRPRSTSSGQALRDWLSPVGHRAILPPDASRPRHASSRRIYGSSISNSPAHSVTYLGTLSKVSPK